MGPTRLMRARGMRRTPTRSEGRVWVWLRDRRFEGYKFRRQHSIGGYVLDFYCAALRLAIEVDGEHHRSLGCLSMTANGPPDYAAVTESKFSEFRTIS